jgi:hypothetical protein
MKKVALIVHSCDRYSFLYEGFAYFFAKYWDFEIDCNLYFATEEKDVSIPNFTTIKSGKGEWSDRLAFLLNEKIKEEYVLYFQEDMWLSKPINKDFLHQLFQLAFKNEWKQVKLHSAAVYKTIETDIYIEGFNIAKIDIDKSSYLMSHQVTLWEKDFFLAQLPKNEHPWRNERKGSKRLKKLNPLLIHADYFAENGVIPINNNPNPILRSEYKTVSLNGMLNNNVLFFIDILENAEANGQEYAKELTYHYENQLTHDGQPKPRKEDIHKRFLKWLKQKLT